MNLQKDLLEVTKYSGSSSKNKVISASMLGSEPLQVYYKVKYGVIEDNKRIDQSTIGTLAHCGLDLLSDSFDHYETRIRKDIKYKDDWTLSAEVDLINYNEKYFCDLKITKEYAYKHINQDSQYAWQLRLQKYIFSKIYPEMINWDMYLFFILKDVKQREKFLLNEDRIYQILNYDDSAIEEKIDYLIYTYNLFESEPQSIQQCGDLWWRKDKDGNSYPSRCTKYCSYTSVCQFYKANSYIKKKNIIGDW